MVQQLELALRSPARRATALLSLDDLQARLRSTDTLSFSSLMFHMNWYTMLGDLDRAYAAAEIWVALSTGSGLAGIPHIDKFWLEEMRAFRADPRFHDVVEKMGMIEYWRRFGAADG